MQALQLTQPRCFSTVQLPLPTLQESDQGKLLVKLRWALVCGSDIPWFAGKKRSLQYPLPPGAPNHECVGEVIASTSDLISPGEYVVAMPEGARGLTEFFVALDSEAASLPPELKYDASPLIQPLATVMYAADKLGEVNGRSIAVVGLGPIGLLFCWLLSLRGAQVVLGIDPCSWRCEVAKQIGATKTFAGTSLELIHSIRQRQDEWKAVDICVEAVGHQTETLNDCIELVRSHGHILSFGIPPHPVYPLEYRSFFLKNLHLLAAVLPDWSQYLPAARDLFYPHRRELESLITHRFPIQDAAHAYGLCETHPNGITKILLDASNW